MKFEPIKPIPPVTKKLKSSHLIHSDPTRSRWSVVLVNISDMLQTGNPSISRAKFAVSTINVLLNYC